jgi:hypothetical protein
VNPTKTTRLFLDFSLNNSHLRAILEVKTRSRHTKEHRKDSEWTNLRGSQKPNAIIDEAKASKIKAFLRDGLTCPAIATIFGLKVGVIKNIKYGSSWAHVK